MLVWPEEPHWLGYEPAPAYSQETWAPELQLINGRWYIYYAASNGTNANHRMFVLESTSLNPQAQGAYAFKGQLRPTTDKWAIDGAVIQKDDGVQKHARSAGFSSCQTGLVSENAQAEYTNYRVY